VDGQAKGTARWGRGRSRITPLLVWLVLGLAAGATLALGTVHSETRLALFTGCAVVLALALIDRARRGRSIAVPVAAQGLAVAVLATLVQLVPLPAPVLAQIAPATDDLLQTVLGADYGVHPLSLDPPSTLAELAKLAAYLAFFLVAVMAARRTGARQRIVLGVTALATVVAMLALIELASGTHQLLFFYTPQDDWAGRFRGTFVNPNHFGALMTLGAPGALALALSNRRLRLPGFAALLLINVAAVLSFSRSALVCVPLGQVLLLGLDQWLRRGPSLSSPRRMAVAAFAAGSLGLAILIGVDEIVPRLAQTWSVELTSPFAEQYSKLHQWPNAVRMLGEHLLTGIGRGAFEPAFLRYSDQSSSVRFAFIENQYLQACVDWGVPVGLALAWCAWRVLVTAWRRLQNDPQGAAAFAGLAALALHECVDFSTELPGLALPALALLATLSADPLRAPDPASLRVRARWWQLTLPLALAALAVLAAGTTSARAAGAALATHVREAKVSLAAVVAEGERQRAEHPAEDFIDAVVAEQLARAGRPEAMRWLNAAIYLNPSNPANHLLAAEVLARAGHKAQALLEYRLAVGVAADRRAVWERVVARYPALADLRAATPADVAAQLDLGAWLADPRHRVADADAVYRAALEENPDNLELARRLVGTAVARGDVAEAARGATELLARDQSRESRSVAVRALVAAGRPEAAARSLDAAGGRDRNAYELELAVAEGYLGAGQLDAARSRLDRLTWTHDPALLAHWHEARGELERRAGNAHQERWEREEAARLRER
jgi:tetratricopeptide (TPR) repeat protein